MPNYIYKCNKCHFKKNIFMSVEKYSSDGKKIFCHCSDDTVMVRVYGDFQSDIEISPDDRLKQIKEEAKIIANKIACADSSLIDSIYGN